MKKSVKSKVGFIDHFVGYWKRTLEIRNFGGLFQHLSTKNGMIKIEEVQRKENPKLVRYLRWSFGNVLKPTELQFAYEMKIRVNSNPLEFEWRQDGSLCRGCYYPSSKTAILHFNTKKTLATVTYTCIDEDRMSVVIVEVNKERMKRNLQYGNLYRTHIDEDS